MSYAQRVIEGLKQKYASEPVFLQAVEEVLMTLQPLLDKDAKYEKNKIHRARTHHQLPCGMGGRQG